MGRYIGAASRAQTTLHEFACKIMHGTYGLPKAECRTAATHGERHPDDCPHCTGQCGLAEPAGSWCHHALFWQGFCGRGSGRPLPDPTPKNARAAFFVKDPRDTNNPAVHHVLLALPAVLHLGDGPHPCRFKTGEPGLPSTHASTGARKRVCLCLSVSVCACVCVCACVRMHA